MEVKLFSNVIQNRPICIEKITHWHMTELEIGEVVDYANEGNKSYNPFKEVKITYNMIKESNW